MTSEVVRGLFFAAAVDGSLVDRRSWVIERTLELQSLEADMERILEARPFRATLRDVVRVKAVNGSPGKARLDLEAADGSAEEIETGWLYPGSLALTVASRAKARKGSAVVVWKGHETDPAGKVSHGFRVALWVDTDHTVAS